jgi:hypothetical protein
VRKRQFVSLARLVLHGWDKPKYSNIDEEAEAAKPRKVSEADRAQRNIVDTEWKKACHIVRLILKHNKMKENDITAVEDNDPPLFPDDLPFWDPGSVADMVSIPDNLGDLLWNK